MLQRNLFAIIIVSLVLVFTSNAFGQWHPEIDRIKSPKDVATGQIKSPRDVASGQATGKAQKSSSRIQPPQPKGMNKTDLTEQLSIKSPRDVASGQATGIKANARTTGKQSSGLLTEITFPKVRQQQNCKWELGEYDASKHISAKPKGYNLGDTATHERHRKGQN